MNHLLLRSLTKSSRVVIFTPMENEMIILEHKEPKAILRCEDEAWDCMSVADAFDKFKFLKAAGLEPEVIPLFPGQCVGCEFHICNGIICTLSARNGKSGCHFFSG